MCFSSVINKKFIAHHHFSFIKDYTLNTKSKFIVNVVLLCAYTNTLLSILTAIDP
jgi:hypothetical protein